MGVEEGPEGFPMSLMQKAASLSRTVQSADVVLDLTCWVVGDEDRPAVRGLTAFEASLAESLIVADSACWHFSVSLGLHVVEKDTFGRAAEFGDQLYW